MNNPLIDKNNQPYNSVPFADIKSKHFLPAIKHFIKRTEENILEICNNKDAPNVDNAIVALEVSGEDLDYVVGIYQNLYASEADKKIRELIVKINPLLTKLSNDIYLNNILFNRDSVTIIEQNNQDNRNSSSDLNVTQSFRSDTSISEDSLNVFNMLNCPEEEDYNTDDNISESRV